MESGGSNRKRLSRETSLAVSSEERRLTVYSQQAMNWFDPHRGSIDRKNIYNCFFDTEETYIYSSYVQNNWKKKIEVGFKPIVRFRVPLGRWIKVPNSFYRVSVNLKGIYLKIIPRVRMGSETIAHEAEGWMGYWLRGHEGERNNCFSKIQLVGQKYRDKTTFSWLKLDVNRFLPPKIRRSSLLVGYNI